MIQKKRMPVFSERLKKLRSERNMSQAQLADAIGVSRGSISFYENGDRLPDIEVFYRLVRFFQTTADYLAGESDFRGGRCMGNITHLGLSEDAVRMLSELHACARRGDDPKGAARARNELNMIDSILTDPNFVPALGYLLYYLESDGLESDGQETENLRWKENMSESFALFLFENAVRGIIRVIKEQRGNVRHREKEQAGNHAGM